MSGSSTCISCPAGKTSSQLDNFQECHLCPGGRYLVARMSHCVPCKICAAGKFRVGCGSDESSQDGRCISCGIGLFKDIAGKWNTTCRMCSKYQYINVTLEPGAPEHNILIYSWTSLGLNLSAPSVFKIRTTSYEPPIHQ